MAKSASRGNKPAASRSVKKAGSLSASVGQKVAATRSLLNDSSSNNAVDALKRLPKKMSRKAIETSATVDSSGDDDEIKAKIPQQKNEKRQVIALSFLDQFCPVLHSRGLVKNSVVGGGSNWASCKKITRLIND